MGKKSGCLAPVDLGAELQNSGPQSLNLSGAKQVVIMVVTPPKLALEGEYCFGVFRREWA